MTRLFSIFISFFFCFSAIADLLPVEAFGNLPQARQVKLAPDGSKIAFIRIIEGGTYIGVTDLKKRKTRYIVKTDNQKFKIAWYVWGNDEMLLLSADYPVQNMGQKYTETRLMKIRVSGEEEIKTVVMPKRRERVPQFQNNIIDMLPEDPDHILMALDLQVANRPDVYKVSLNNNKRRTIVYRNKTDINNWMTDRQNRVRLGFGRDDTKIFYRLYDLASKEWRNIWEYEIFDAPDITPLGFGLNPNELYIRANHNGRYALFKVDLTKPDLPRELVYADEHYDIEGSLIYSQKTNDVIGIYHGEASDAKVFFEPSYAAFQKALNHAFPDAYNNISSMSADERKYILFTSNPKSPGTFYLGDRDKKSLEFVLDQYPLLYEKKLSGKQKVTYKARDGLTIEAYLTLPHQGVANQHAALVIPHGGPMARTYGGFDWFSEFFASRGYTVLEPNFRGSSGYGFEFEMASVQKWGGAMQDDLADAANWLVANQKIGEKRICILGASYGGYAAMMAAAKQQGTFKCAASFAGVSDLKYIVRKARKFTNYKVVKKQLGTDNDVLEQQSPINYVKDISIPLMLIHGDKDRVVDVSHSRKMYEELSDLDKQVDYIELENGNHHLGIQANRVKALTSFDRFLKQHLAP